MAKNEIETECVRCGVPAGEYVVRDNHDPLRWTMDITKAFRDNWGKPTRIYLFRSSGLCGKCDYAAYKAGRIVGKNEFGEREEPA